MQILVFTCAISKPFNLSQNGKLRRRKNILRKYDFRKERSRTSSSKTETAQKFCLVECISGCISELKPVAWMVILGDCLSAPPSVSASPPHKFAAMCPGVPHELGSLGDTK